MIVNTALMNVVSIDRLIELGFKEHNDGTESPFGYWWEITNERYSVVVDPWYEIRLYQVNPDSEGIMLFAEDEYELQNIIDFVNTGGLPCVFNFYNDEVTDEKKREIEEAFKKYSLNQAPIILHSGNIEIESVKLRDEVIRLRLSKKRSHAWLDKMGVDEMTHVKEGCRAQARADVLEGRFNHMIELMTGVHKAFSASFIGSEDQREALNKMIAFLNPKEDAGV